MFSPDDITDLIEQFGIARGNPDLYGGGHARYPSSRCPKSEPITRPNYSPFAQKLPNNSAQFSLDEDTMRALELLQKVGRYLSVYDDPYSPNRKRRAEIVEKLSQRPSLTHEEFHARFAAPKGIPLQFVRWFRGTCSKYFEYDLSAALPDDRLVEDLGLFSATWGDTDWDIFEEYEGEFRCKRPQSEEMKTFGSFLEGLWAHARRHGTSNQSLQPTAGRSDL